MGVLTVQQCIDMQEQANQLRDENMALYGNLPKITSTITEESDGSHITRVFKAGVVISETPTPVSQVRPHRTSMLYSVDEIKDKTFTRSSRKQ